MIFIIITVLDLSNIPWDWLTKFFGINFLKQGKIRYGGVVHALSRKRWCMSSVVYFVEAPMFMHVTYSGIILVFAYDCLPMKVGRYSYVDTCLYWILTIINLSKHLISQVSISL